MAFEREDLKRRLAAGESLEVSSDGGSYEGRIMHLRFEPRLIYAIAITPIVLFVALTLALVRDIVFGR